MPCYLVQTCTVTLHNADFNLLERALKALGFQVERLGPRLLRFTRGQVTGTYDGRELRAAAPNGEVVNLDEVKREYSHQVIDKKVAAFRQKGWKVERRGNQVRVSKPTTARRVRA